MSARIYPISQNITANNKFIENGSTNGKMTAIDPKTIDRLVENYIVPYCMLHAGGNIRILCSWLAELLAIFE